MSDEAIFSRWVARALAWTGGLTLAVTLLYMVFGDPGGEVDTLGANSFSRSALGYRALVEALEEEVPVVVSRLASEHKASPSAPLLLLEPPTHRDGLAQLARVLGVVRERGLPAVVVLPKWRGTREAGRLTGAPRGWVTRVEPLPVADPRRVLATLFGDAETRTPRAEIHRPGPVVRSATAELPYPQLIRSSRLDTVVAHGDDALIARLPDAEIYVIADPDLLNNAGLGRGDNARLVHELLIGRLAPGALVVDEVLHGFERNPSLWRALLELPLICVTLHLAALLAAVSWATVHRFGRPLRPPPRLPPGKLTLLDNSARLLTLADRSRHAVERYLELVARSAAGRMSLPPGLTPRERIDRLSKIGRRRGVREDLDHLSWRVSRLPLEGVEPSRALALAHALHGWRKEMFDGADTST